MTRYNYQGCYLYFEKTVTNTDLQPIVNADSVHFCNKYEVEELYLERHDKTRYKAIISLDCDKVIELVDYNLNDLDNTLQSLITPVWLMREMYKNALKRNTA